MGEMFGRYRLDAQLGAGGMGEVWRAFDTDLERVVALKMLLPRFRDDPDSARRFLREAQMAARLRHPHIAHVNTFGEIDKRLYLDMELVRGSSLAAVLATRGCLGAERAVEVVEDVADALDAAHALGDPEDQRMVHRDVKPANVLLEPRRGGREHVYLVDFGVARTVAQGASITVPGSVVGTPAYIAPEVWEGHRADHRIDVYALAVTLFEMLTGTVPFPRSTMHGFLTAHLSAPVPAASALRPGLPPGLDAVIVRGMAKDPRQRYPTAGALADAARATLRDVVAAPITVTGAGPGPPPIAPTPVAPDLVARDSTAPDVRRLDVTGPDVMAPDPAPPGPARAGSVDAGSFAPGPIAPRPVDAGSFNAGSVHPGSVNARPVDPRPVDPRPVDRRSSDSESADPGPVDRGSFDAGAADPGPLDRGSVDRGSVDPRPADHGAADRWGEPPDESPPPPYIGSVPHLVGLAAALLVVPLYLLDVIGFGWPLFLLPVVLYALGAATTTAVQRLGR